jgi:NADPH:quinone reductase-like Zn-dependent oxidoreductase
MPIPNIEPDQVLIQTMAVALNPSDWKLIDAASCTPGAVSGGDFAGVVVQAGLNVDNIHLGDRVFGCAFGANPNWPGNGAFAEHVAVAADLCFRMPEWMSFETATSLGLGLMTVGLAFKSLGLIMDYSEQKSMRLNSLAREFVLVYGGSTATGTLAMQLLRLHGYLPIATCSRNNFDLARQYGAEAVFDHSSPTCKSDIRKYTGGQLAYTIDCITDSRATTICYGALGPFGGKYCALESFPDRLRRRRKNVIPDFILGLTIFGQDVELAGEYRRRAQPEDRQFATGWAAHCSEIVKDGRLQTHPLEVRSGGLGQIVDDIDLLRKNKISGKKLVYLT